MSVQIVNTRVRSTRNRIRHVRHGNSSEEIDAQLSKVEDDGEKEHRSETSITKFRRQKREKLRQGAVVTSCRGLSGFERGKGICYQWKAKGHQCSRDDHCSSGTRVTIVQNRHQKPLRPVSHQHQEVEVRGEEGASDAEASLGSPTDSSAKTS